jgi:hypothetical protein
MNSDSIERQLDFDLDCFPCRFIENMLMCVIDSHRTSYECRLETSRQMK